MPWVVSMGLYTIILGIDWTTYEVGWRQRVVFQTGWLGSAVYAPLVVFFILLIWRLIVRDCSFATLIAVLLETPLFIGLWFLMGALYVLTTGLGYI